MAKHFENEDISVVEKVTNALTWSRSKYGGILKAFLTFVQKLGTSWQAEDGIQRGVITLYVALNYIGMEYGVGGAIF